VIWLACAPSVSAVNGQFWFDRQSRKTHILPWQSHSSTEKKRLWAKLEAVIIPYLSDTP